MERDWRSLERKTEDKRNKVNSIRRWCSSGVVRECLFSSIKSIRIAENGRLVGNVTYVETFMEIFYFLLWKILA